MSPMPNQRTTKEKKKKKEKFLVLRVRNEVGGSVVEGRPHMKKAICSVFSTEKKAVRKLIFKK